MTHEVVGCVGCCKPLRLPLSLFRTAVRCPRCDTRWSRLPYQVVDVVQGTPAWRMWRNQGVGASDAPTIMGENPRKPRHVFLEERRRGLQPEENEAMRRGVSLEPEARSLYEETTRTRVRPICLRSRRHDWLRASLDGLSDDGRTAVEIKCGKHAYDSAKSGQVPTHYRGQLQQILAVTGLSQISFWCFLPARPPVHLIVARDDQYIARLLIELEAFWLDLRRT